MYAQYQIQEVGRTIKYLGSNLRNIVLDSLDVNWVIDPFKPSLNSFLFVFACKDVFHELPKFESLSWVDFPI